MISSVLKSAQVLGKPQHLAKLNNIYGAAFSSQKFSDKLNNLRNQENQQQQKINVEIPQGSTAQQVFANAGVNAYINRVYKASGAGIVTALGTSQLAIGAGLPFMYGPMVLGIGGLVLGVGGMFATMKQTPKTIIEYKNGIEMMRTENSPMRIGTYGLAMAGLGLSASPLFAMVAMQNPAILPTAIGISSALFGASSVYAYTRPKDSLLSWGSSLMGALYGLIGMQVAGMLTTAVIGPNMFSNCLHRVDTFAGIGIFSAMIAYDTHVAIKTYEEGSADHLLTSLDFALDFWNILVRVTQVLSMFSGND